MTKCLYFSEEFKWWSKTAQISSGWSKRSKTLDVEVTSYALLTILDAGKFVEGLATLRWLLNERNAEGGFQGSQDTVLGLEALAQYAEMISSKDSCIEITVKNEVDGDEKQLEVNRENALVLQTIEVSSGH